MKKLEFLFLFLIVILTIVPRMILLETDNSISDELKNSYNNYYLTQYDSWYYYKEAKHPTETNFMIYSNIIAHKVFGGNDLMQTLKYVNLFYMCLAAISLYFLIKLYVKNNMFAFFGAILFSLNFKIIMNTYFGYVDTDSLILLFSIIIIYFQIKAKEVENTKTNLKYLIILILLIVLFDLTWKGFFYIILIILLAFALNLKNNLLKILLFMFNVWWFVLTFDRSIIYLSYPLSIVSEIQKESIYYMLIYVVPILYIIYLRFKYKEFKYDLLLVWVVVTFVMGLFATRNIILLIIPTVIIFMIFLEWLLNHIKPYQRNIALVFGCIFIVFSSMIIQIPRQTLTPMDDTVVDAMSLIGNKTIVAWWDYGSLYKALDKKVMYSNTPMQSFEMYEFLNFISQDDWQAEYKYNKESYVLVINQDDLRRLSQFINFTEDSLIYNIQDKNCVRGKIKWVCFQEMGLTPDI